MTSSTTQSPSTAADIDLKSIISRTQAASSHAMVLQDSRTIPVSITAYETINGELVAHGTDLTSAESVTMKLISRTKQTGEKKNRDMNDIMEVSPVGTTVIFQNCFPDKDNASLYTSYYAQTPFNVELKENQKKQVKVEIKPGRLLKTTSGRVAGALYEVADSLAVTSTTQAYENAAKLFAAGKSVLVRVRVNTTQNNESIVQNEAFEFYPVHEAVTDPVHGKRTSINVNESVKQIAKSIIGQAWINQIDGPMKEYIGKGVDIDMVPITLTWFGVAKAREGKAVAEDKRYGLSVKNGLFAPQIENIQNDKGQAQRKYNTVVTNLIVSTLTLTDDTGERSMLLAASTLNTRPKLITNHNIPCVVGGQVVFKPSEHHVFNRHLKSDGTFELPRMEHEVENSREHKPAAANEATSKTSEQPAPLAATTSTGPDSASSQSTVSSTTIEPQATDSSELPQDVQSSVEQNMAEIDFDDLDIDIDSILGELEATGSPDPVMAP